MQKLAVKGLVVHLVFEFFGVFPGDLVVAGLGIKNCFVHLASPIKRATYPGRPYILFT
jgi:hypothetical protein